MLLGRSAELQNLDQYYQKDGSQILVVYGQRYIGKTELVKEFSNGKPMSYYHARSCSGKEQRYQWGKEWKLSEEFPSYKDLFLKMYKDVDKTGTKKHILIVDEFQNLVKHDSSFMKELVEFVQKNEGNPPCFIILCSSSVGFIENSLVKKIGEAAFSLSGLIKIKELKFVDLVDFFPGFSIKECIETYSILGGFPGLWQFFSDKESIKENIIKNFLEKNSTLVTVTENFITDELRETAVYYTILSALASGKMKLNDLYNHTDFSRAKISVYLKNLMELEMVEKVFSYDTEGKSNSQKGIYRISNPLVHFYFQYLYPNQSCLQNQKSLEFFQECIAPTFRFYASRYFQSVCKEQLLSLNRKGKLPIQISRSGEWVGKLGNIDVVAQDKDGKTLIALCNYDKPLMTYADYEWLLFCAKKAKIQADYIYLYSIDRFDEKLNLEAKVKKNLFLVSIND